jgi:hypothetical protein
LGSVTNEPIVTHTPPESTEPATYATARVESADALLLYAFPQDHEFASFEQQVSDDHRRLTLVASKPSGEANIESWMCQLTLGSAREISDEEASARAMEYAEPAGIELAIGSYVAPPGHTLDANGFDHAAGCHVITPDLGRVRLLVDGTGRPRFCPAFQIVNAQNREAWVYVNHLVFDRVARDGDGNLIFQVPNVVRDRTTIEVLFRRVDTFDGA